MPEDTWLTLLFRLPPEPSRVRVGIWRRLKRLGALHLEGCWLLPAIPAAEEALLTLVADIEGGGGRATLLRSVPIGPRDATRVRDAFLAERATEYSDVARECGHVIDHIQREQERANFTVHEAGELEADVEKVRRWYEAAVGRDLLEGADRAATARTLQAVEDRFTAFLEETYRRTDSAC